MNLRAPLPYRVAALGEIRCIATTFDLLRHRLIRLPREHIGMCMRFADGTSARVYRETVIDGRVPADPCVLLVEFQLRLLKGWGHALFRWESLLNTPLFVGFPGFVSKLWLAHDEHGVYRGLYEWDGPDRAEYYARCLWPVLALGSVPGSIHYQVLPGLQRDELLQTPRRLESIAPAGPTWWRLLEVA
jgi:hypothetical protein